MTEDRKKTALIITATTLLAAAALVLIALRPATAKHEPEVSAPIPLGTNSLKVGALLYNPKRTNEVLWVVQDINPTYEFPDGEIRPAVKVRSESNRISTWIPRENLRSVLVVQ